jgi:hypothetical protein
MMQIALPRIISQVLPYPALHSKTPADLSGEGPRAPIADRIKIWSRREDLNAPSADYNSAALPLSYTGVGKSLSRTTVPEPAIPS